MVAWVISFVVFYSLSCGSHLSALWGGDLSFVEYCVKLTEKFEEAYAISDFILDSLVLLVPLPSVSRSTFPKARGRH